MQSRRFFRVSAVLALFLHMTGCDPPGAEDMDSIEYETDDEEVLRALEVDDTRFDDAESADDDPDDARPTTRFGTPPGLPGPGDGPTSGKPRPCRPQDLKWKVAFGGTGSPPSDCPK
jgi:hypothetical protein